MTPRSVDQRKRDTLETLQRGGDAWVASASPDGIPHLVALTYFWDGARLTVATAQRNRTARNLANGRRARMALDLTADVVTLEGPVESIPVNADDTLAEAFAAATGYDARKMTPTWTFLRLTPTRIQAMRSPEEEASRTIMRGGVWVDD